MSIVSANKKLSPHPNLLPIGEGIYGHSEALAEESQGLGVRATRVPRRPEFISGSCQLGIKLQAGKMLNQVQHDQELHPLPMEEGMYGHPEQSEELQGLGVRATRVHCRPEFNSGPYRLGVGLQACKVLKRVQHDNYTCQPKYLPLLKPVQYDSFFPLLAGEGKGEVSS